MFNFKKKGNEVADVDLTEQEIKEIDAAMSPVFTPGTLDPTEPHPAAKGAEMYLKTWFSTDISGVAKLEEALKTTALTGNRLSEVCSETLRRMMNNEPVSDRYVLGLAWTVRNLREKPKPVEQTATDIVK